MDLVVVLALVAADVATSGQEALAPQPGRTRLLSRQRRRSLRNRTPLGKPVPCIRHRYTRANILLARLQASTPVMLTKTMPLSPTQPRLRCLAPSHPYLPPKAQASHERQRQAEYQHTFWILLLCGDTHVRKSIQQHYSASGRRVQYFCSTGPGFDQPLMQASVASGDAFLILKSVIFVYLSAAQRWASGPQKDRAKRRSDSWVAQASVSSFLGNGACDDRLVLLFPFTPSSPHLSGSLPAQPSDQLRPRGRPWYSVRVPVAVLLGLGDERVLGQGGHWFGMRGRIDFGEVCVTSARLGFGKCFS